MVTKVLLAVLILLALGTLYLLFHLSNKPQQKEEEVDYQPTPYRKDIVPLNTAVKNATDAINKLDMAPLNTAVKNATDAMNKIYRVSDRQ